MSMLVQDKNVWLALSLPNFKTMNDVSAVKVPQLCSCCFLPQDRCHRIGQTREVHIYRLISQNTIEENILRKSDQKRQLDWLAIQSGGFNTDFLAKIGPGMRRDRPFFPCHVVCSVPEKKAGPGSFGHRRLFLSVIRGSLVFYMLALLLHPWHSACAVLESEQAI
jgi:hypothetical protein